MYEKCGYEELYIPLVCIICKNELEGVTRRSKGEITRKIKCDIYGQGVYENIEIQEKKVRGRFQEDVE